MKRFYAYASRKGKITINRNDGKWMLYVIHDITIVQNYRTKVKFIITKDVSTKMSFKIRGITFIYSTKQQGESELLHN